MKIRVFTLIASLLFAFILHTGCQKELDVRGEDGEIVSTPLPTTDTYCRIESIWQHPGTPREQFLLVLYDEYENPVAITSPYPNSWDNTYRTFKYDSWHRLRELIEDYGTGRYQFWHFYGYDQNGRISVDTTYYNGLTGQKPTENTNRQITTFTYDDQGRIIHEKVRSDPENGFDYHFYYDANGNRGNPGQVTYDNKMNFNRTNDIWMFLSRDYSKNNPFVAEEYNVGGFPTRLNSNFLGIYIWLRAIDLRGARIGYSCRPSNYY